MDCWEKIVVLHRRESNDQPLSVNDSRSAARVLLTAWPVREGRSYRRAILSCSAAVQGRVPPDMAQWAFIVAAMEAAMSYEVIDRFDTEIAAVCRQLIEEEPEPEAVEVPMTGEDVLRPFWWPKRSSDAPLVA